MTYRRLPLEGLRNARDLGGYPTYDGGITRFSKFIRSESPKSVTHDDLQFLKACGITDSIDFRGDSETQRSPSVFAAAPDFIYHRCPTFDKQLAFAAGSISVSAFVNWGDKYIELVERSRAWVCDTLTVMAGAKGGVIYNCTTGKDRTGVISALLLSLAGVSEADIIADYCVSEIYLVDIYEDLLSKHFARWSKEETNLDNPFFRTAPENMKALLDYLRDHHGGIERYVKECGVSDDVLTTLRERLVAF